MAHAEISAKLPQLEPILVQGHWSIGNRSHWMRDIGLMRYICECSIAAACRRFADQPLADLALLGIYPKNGMPLPP